MQAVLDRYLCEHNRKFSQAAQPQPAWKKIHSQPIDQALCVKEKRTVANDNTVTFDRVIFQIPEKSPYRSYANKRIDVHVGLDGSVEFFYKTEKSPHLTQKTRTRLAYNELDRCRQRDRLRRYRYDQALGLADPLRAYMPIQQLAQAGIKVEEFPETVANTTNMGETLFSL